MPPTTPNRCEDAMQPSEVNGEHCPICLVGEMGVDEEATTTPCQHRFGADCLSRWCDENMPATCPICRNVLRPARGSDRAFDALVLEIDNITFGERFGTTSTTDRSLVSTRGIGEAIARLERSIETVRSLRLRYEDLEERLQDWQDQYIVRRSQSAPAATPPRVLAFGEVLHELPQRLHNPETEIPRIEMGVRAVRFSTRIHRDVFVETLLTPHRPEPRREARRLSPGQWRNEGFNRSTNRRMSSPVRIQQHGLSRQDSLLESSEAHRRSRSRIAPDQTDGRGDCDSESLYGSDFDSAC